MKLNLFAIFCIFLVTLTFLNGATVSARTIIVAADEYFYADKNVVSLVTRFDHEDAAKWQAWQETKPDNAWTDDLGNGVSFETWLSEQKDDGTWASFLKKRGLPYRGNEFEGLVSEKSPRGDKAREALIEYSVNGQIEATEKALGEDITLVIVPSQVDVPYAEYRELAKNAGRGITGTLGAVYNVNKYKKMVEEDLEEIRANVIKESGVKIDPKKDFVVVMSPSLYLMGTYEYDGFFYHRQRGLPTTKGIIGIPPPFSFADIPKGMLSQAIAQETLHLCSQSSYTLWKAENRVSRILFFKGCPNTYDRIGCCLDNPKWWKKGKFDKEGYEDNLKLWGVGVACLPKGAEQDVECIEALGKEGMLLGEYVSGRFDVLVDLRTMTEEALERERKRSTKSGAVDIRNMECFGSPCSFPDGGPPYCRDVMGENPDGLDACFGDQEAERKIIIGKEGGDYYYK